MVLQHNLGDLIEEFNVPEDLIGSLRMYLDQGELDLREAARLAENIRRYGYLAQVVEKPGGADSMAAIAGQAHLLAMA